MLRRFAISVVLLSAALAAAARTRPHYGGTLRVEIAGDPWQGTEGLARQLVFDGLTALDADGALRPALASDWHSDDTGHRWQFRLRPGVRFHDGSPLTATAVEMALNVACKTTCPWTAVRAVGSSVIFNSDQPLPQLPQLLAGDTFLIALTRTADGQTPAQPIGTGPFQVSASAGNTLTLAANDTYWQGRPFLDQILLTSHRTVRDQWLDLGVGRADVVEVPTAQLRQAQQQHLTVLTSPPVMLLALQVSSSGALANPMLRTAIASAVDRNAICNVIYQKQGQVAGSLLPQSLTGYAFLFPADRDLARANAARGGLNPGPILVAADGDGAMQLTAQRLALNLREAGFNAQMATSANAPRADLVLRRLPLAGAEPAGVLARVLLAAGQPDPLPLNGLSPETLFRAEHDSLALHNIVPLLDLPRSYAIGGRVRNLRLDSEGTPDLAAVSLEEAP